MTTVRTGFASRVRPRRIPRALAFYTVVCIVVAASAIGPTPAAQVSNATPPTGASGSSPELMTVSQAVQEALDRNLDLLAKQADVTIAEARNVTARLRPNPVFSFGADHLDWLGTGFNDVNGGGPTELGWRVDVPIERGNKRDLRIDEAGAARSVAEAKVGDAVRTLSQQVELACVDVSQATENLTLARDTLRTFEDLATLNDERVRSGAAAPYEATRTRVAMLQFRATVSRAELDLRTASIRLRQIVGRPASSDPLAVVASSIRAPDQSLDLPSLERLALQHRPDLRAAQLSQARSVADLRLQLAEGRVDFTWGAEYRRQAGPIGRSNSVGLFFSAPLPISNRNQGEIARAHAEGIQAGRETAALDSAIRAEVRAAFDTYTTTAALVTAIEHDLIQPAQNARDIAAYSYRSSATTLVELIDSQRAWNDAMQSYHDAQAEYRRAVARLNAAVGTGVIQ